MATPGDNGRTSRTSLQGRDPFSGDCDCISNSSYQFGVSGRLAGTRPVFRGLRPINKLAPTATSAHALQGRDPFSGDCDGLLAVRTRIAGIGSLQGRDPFSGDCDAHSLGDNWHGRKFFLQGRDPFSGDCDSITPGGTRTRYHACRDETRFQGIATASASSFPSPFLPPACRDETRFQGIATRFAARPGRPPGPPRLAGTRPVFRGLRPWRAARKLSRAANLQG